MQRLIDTVGLKRTLLQSEIDRFLVGKKNHSQAFGLAADVKLRSFAAERGATIPSQFAEYDFELPPSQGDFKCSATGNFSVSCAERAHLMLRLKAAQPFFYLLYDIEGLNFTHLGQVDGLEVLEAGLLRVSQYKDDTGNFQYYLPRTDAVKYLIPSER